MPATTMMTRAAASRALLGEQTMQAGDAHVVHPLDVIAHDFGRSRGFFRHREVRRSRGRDDDGALAGCDILLAKHDQRGIGMVGRVRNDGADGVERGSGALASPAALSLG